MPEATRPGGRRPAGNDDRVCDVAGAVAVSARTGATGVALMTGRGRSSGGAGQNAGVQRKRRRWEQGRLALPADLGSFSAGDYASWSGVSRNGWRGSRVLRVDGRKPRSTAGLGSPGRTAGLLWVQVSLAGLELADGPDLCDPKSWMIRRSMAAFSAAVRSVLEERYVWNSRTRFFLVLPHGVGQGADSGGEVEYPGPLSGSAAVVVLDRDGDLHHGADYFPVRVFAADDAVRLFEFVGLLTTVSVWAAPARLRFSAGRVPSGIRTRSVRWRVLRVILPAAV